MIISTSPSIIQYLQRKRGRLGSAVSPARAWQAGRGAAEEGTRGGGDEGSSVGGARGSPGLRTAEDRGAAHVADDKGGEEKIVKTLHATTKQKTLRRQDRTGFGF